LIILEGIVEMKKVPFVTKEQVEEIAKKYPTPFYLYDEKGIRETARSIYKAFSWNKGYKEYFAVKATPNPFILQILKEEGCGTDCSSATELMMSEVCGFKGEEIMFSSNDTPHEEYALAARLGAIINLDDFTMIDVVEKTLGKIPETICCRYNPGGKFALGNKIMDDPGDSKYGMTKEQLLEAFKILKAKGAKHFGIHAFLASNTVTNEYYPELARQLFSLAVEVKHKTGVTVEFINLSGGVGIPYRPEQTPNDIMTIGSGVHKVYDEIFGPEGMTNVRLMTEMGRFVTGPYGALVSKVINFKHIYKEYVGMDACAANLIRPAMYGAYHHITVLGKENEPCDHKYDVTGGLCENNDKFAVDRMLPKIELGDYLFMHDAGAHCYAMGYNYNGKLWCAELLLCEDGSVKMIRRAQTPKDYFATLDFTGLFDHVDEI
jgi:diaminopimelate decarboxylase